MVCQPLHAIGIKLLEESYEAALFTNLNEVAHIESCSLKAQGISLDFAEQLKSPRYKQALATSGTSIQGWPAMRSFCRPVGDGRGGCRR